MKRLTNDLQPIVKLIFDLVLMLLIFLIVFFLGVLAAKLISGVSFSQLLHAGSGNNPGLLRYSVVLQSLGLFFIPAWVIAALYDRPANYLQARKLSSSVIFLMVFVLMLAVQPFVSYLAQINTKMHFPASMSEIEQWMRFAEEQTNLLTKKMLAGTSVTDLIVSLLVIALIPAMGEEFLFRGILQKHFIELVKNKHIGIFLTAFVFSAIHFQFFTFLPRFLLGLILGYLFVWTKSIWTNIWAHFINNAMGVFMYFYANTHGLDPQSVESYGNGKNFVFLALVSLVITISLLYGIKKQSDIA